MTIDDISNYVKKQKQKQKQTQSQNEYKMVSSNDEEEMNSKKEKDEIKKISEEINIIDTNNHHDGDEDIHHFACDHDDELLDNEKIENLKKDVLHSDL